MEDLVDEAKRKGDEIDDDVKVWLSEVDGKITEVEEKYFGAEDTTEMKCTFKGSFSYLASWYKLGKMAKEMGESVVKLKGRINFGHISFRSKLQSHFENKDYLRSVTREEFVDEIMEELGDANIKTIGLHEMPGVGKTTLVKEITRKALKDDLRLFNDAVIVTISQTLDLEKIQQHIAERLDLELKKK
ncbi:putative disease resistance protein At3g15700 [Ziziphus jujuba]|uniref:Disease resistance protein At3g15700 n=1 Tax=Ziziphus jujuba TaxID=326968 RepID=A0ABM4AFS6_ZIZJJ|nr:putative disease resistance protein At3g15700 [Ziziphus jujuba]